MSEKIEWYKEVLALEPNSKVFFPLARMLAGEQNVGEAITILQHGLERHSEFLEARLYLIELLFLSGKHSECTYEIENLTKMFSSYAGFWQAWATVAAVKNSPDISIIIRLLAASFENKTLTLHEILEKGLSLTSPEIQQPTFNTHEDVEQTIIRSNDVDVQNFPVALSTDITEDDSVVGTSTITAESEEQFTLRTRSMAEVLAEQGDIKGALDIYQELEASTSSSEEQADLHQRIATLHARLSSADIDSSVQENIPVGKDKLINMLELLAARVEARAQN